MEHLKSALRPIADVASELGLKPGDVEPYGSVKAKVPLDAFPTRRVPGRLVVVTAITPTPAGEGNPRLPSG